MANRIQIRRDVSTVWALVNPILAQGEIGFEVDFNRFKIGDGVSTWASLPYTPDLAAVALSGSYNDLINVPALVRSIGADIAPNINNANDSNIVMSTILIPAGTIPTGTGKGALMVYEAGVWKDTTANALNITFCINTSPVYGGQVFTGNNETSSRRWNKLERTIVCYENEVRAFAGNGAVDDVGAIAAPSIVTGLIDWSVDQYIMLIVSVNTAGTNLYNFGATLTMQHIQ